MADIDNSHREASAKQLFSNHKNILKRRKCLRKAELKPASHVSRFHAKKSKQTKRVDHTHKKFIGDDRLERIYKFLAVIDDGPYERSANQVSFHDAFITASGRCIYREEWDVHKRAIQAKNGWTHDSSEILVSTPRRFGKTFSVAMFSAVMSLSFGTQIAMFSPAARGSRSILERVHYFVIHLGYESHIITFNQENLRVKTLDGKTSLVRSFPSKIEVCPPSSLT